MKRTDVFDYDRYGITGPQPSRRLLRHSDTMRRPSEDHCSREQRRTSAQELNKARHVKNHIVGVPVLNNLVIESRLESKVVGIRDLILGLEARAQRGKGVEGLSSAPLTSIILEPPIASAYVVATTVSENVVESGLPGDILAGLPDHND